MTLLDLIFGKVFGEHVAHVLRSKGNGEGKVCFVLCHGRDGDIGGIGKVGFRAAVDVSEELGDFPDSIRAVVEEKEGVVI